MFFLIVFNYQNPGWFSPILFRPEMFRTSMFRTCLEAKHFTVFRYFSRVIIPLKLIITYTRIEICFFKNHWNSACFYACTASTLSCLGCLFTIFMKQLQPCRFIRFRTRGVNCVVITIIACHSLNNYLYFYYENLGVLL